MTYTLRLATEATRDLVVEALRAEASKRTRVASKASLSVAEDRLAKRDVRSASVRVTALLAEAAQLGALADELALAEALPVMSAAVVEASRAPSGTIPADGGVDLSKLDDPTPLDVAAGMLGVWPDDDGLSEAAHRAAELAGLEDAFVDPDGEDVETGATAEDEPGDDVAEALT
jgi:hypothetical protein